MSSVGTSSVEVPTRGLAFAVPASPGCVRPPRRDEFARPGPQSSRL